MSLPTDANILTIAVTLNNSGQLIGSGTGLFLVNSGALYNVVSGFGFAATNTGQLTGAFYPLNSNPASYITTGQTGSFGGSTNTGALTGAFYPLNNNPSGYIIPSQTGNFVTISQTGIFASASATGSFITTGQTGNFQSALGYIPLNKAGDASTGVFISSGAEYFIQTGIGTGSGFFSMVILENPTLATTGKPIQLSPALHFSGSSWVQSGSGISGSQPSNWRIYNAPISGQSASSNFIVDYFCGTGTGIPYTSGIVINSNPQNRLGVNGTVLVSYKNTNDYTNTNGQDVHFLLYNPDGTQGQTVVASYFGTNSTPAGKWRTDFAGNISWVAATQHYFFVGADYPAGSIQMSIDSSNIRLNATTFANTITDFSSIYGFDFSNGFITENSITVIDLSTRNLVDSNATLSIAWDGRALYDSGGNQSLDYSNRILNGAWSCDTSFSVNGNSVVTSNQTGNFVTTSQTGVFYPTSNPSGYVTTGQTGAFGMPPNVVYLSGGQTVTGVKTFASGMVVSGSLSGTNFFSGSSNFNTIFYPLGSNPSGYITSGQTGNFVTTGQTGIFITTGQTGAFGGSANTGALTGVFYPLTGNPSGFATTGSLINIQSTTGATSGTFTLDWRQSTTYQYNLTGNTTFNFTGLVNGQTVVVAVYNTGTYTASWPNGGVNTIPTGMSGVKWPQGLLPSQSVSGKTDVYTFININNIVYGNVIQGF